MEINMLEIKTIPEPTYSTTEVIEKILTMDEKEIPLLMEIVVEEKYRYCLQDLRNFKMIINLRF